MEQSDILEKLDKKGVRPTANRILVLKELGNVSGPVSLSDLEDRLPNMDKSSIFRVLALFMEHDVVDSFEDGRGMLNYELCESEGKCNHSDAHIHFYCERCHKSYCLKDVPLSDIELPEGFVPHSISFVINGVCPECRKRQ